MVGLVIAGIAILAVLAVIVTLPAERAGTLVDAPVRPGHDRQLRVAPIAQGRRPPLARRLEVRVLNRHDLPVQNCEVSLVSTADDSAAAPAPRTARPNGAGLWVIEDVSQGECVVQVFAPGHHRVEKRCRIEDAPVTYMTVVIERVPDIEFALTPALNNGQVLSVEVFAEQRQEPGIVSYNAHVDGAAEGVGVILPDGAVCKTAIVSRATLDGHECLGVYTHQLPPIPAPITPTQRIIVDGSRSLRLQLVGDSWRSYEGVDVQMAMKNPRGVGSLAFASGAVDYNGRYTFGNLPTAIDGLRLDIVSSAGQALATIAVTPEMIAHGEIAVALEGPGSIECALVCSPYLAALMRGEEVGVGLDATVPRGARSGVHRTASGVIRLMPVVDEWVADDGDVSPADIVRVNNALGLTVEGVAPGRRMLLVYIPTLNVMCHGEVIVRAGQCSQLQVSVRGHEPNGTELVARDPKGAPIEHARWTIGPHEIAAVNAMPRCVLRPGDTLYCVAAGYQPQSVSVPSPVPGVIEIVMSAKASPR